MPLNLLGDIRKRWERRGVDRKLVILDDIFPHLLSAFRIVEYNTYLATYPDAVVHSTGAAFPLIYEHRDFGAVRDEYEARYPQFRGRALAYDSSIDLSNALVYAVFLHNAYTFLEDVERSGAPFIFTLYPGGRFKLRQEDSDRMLRAVLSSPCFLQVIATQRVTYQYLLELGICRPEQIEFVQGGLFPVNQPKVPRRYYKHDKDSFDICFVANKYMRGGIDKGFDVFLDVARRLAALHSDVRFHVVGAFDASDGDMTGLDGIISFYGLRPTDFFPDFYAGMDMILSPNKPFVLSEGAFDGFPTGSCVEAGMSGVPLFCTDPLQLNTSLRDGEEIVIIPEDADGIVELIEPYYQDPSRLEEMGKKGQAALRREYDTTVQMAPRLRLIDAGLRAPGFPTRVQ
jgi:glycosyltransferase involved in cell wall biosynthesis